MSLTSSLLKERARGVGFDLCGVAPVADHPGLRFLDEWIARGYAGEMEYLTRSANRRADVRRVLPSARSVIALGTIYNVDRPYSTQIVDAGQALISRYAWGEDYHEVIGRRLDALLAWMHEASETPFEAKAYVDTGHVQERAYAQQAGLGWIGRNTCLIHRELGSWIFLSEILCSLGLEADTPGFDQCGTCTLCLEACPTGALVEPGVLDARRCISYLTIELKSAVPDEWRAALGSHVYGCDICQEVCPFNHSAPISRDPAWEPRPAFDAPRLSSLAATSDDELRAAMRGSAMKRTGVARLRRNVDIALANSRDSGGAPHPCAGSTSSTPSQRAAAPDGRNGPPSV